MSKNYLSAKIPNPNFSPQKFAKLILRKSHETNLYHWYIETTIPRLWTKEFEFNGERRGFKTILGAQREILDYYKKCEETSDIRSSWYTRYGNPENFVD